MPIVTANGAKLDHPLLQRLHELDRHIRDNFTLPRYADPGVGAVGLILHSPLENGGYICSPSNALMFARTGGDGDHFSLLIDESGVIDESSPVILTWPSEGRQIIAGASLYDFLCFGMHGGYFALLYGEGEPTVDYEGLLFHSHVELYQQKVISLLARELNLKPWPQDTRGNRHQSLQKQYLPQVEVPQDP